MQHIQKKLTANVLLLLIVMPLLFSVFLLVRQKLIQQEAVENLETASLQTITIRYADLHWLKSGEEVVIDGKLFDVRSYTLVNDQISLTGLYDGKEDELLQQMTTMIQQKNGNNSPLDNSTVKFLFLPVFNEQLAFSIDNDWLNIKQHFSRYTELIREEDFSSPAPPPKFI